MKELKWTYGYDVSDVDNIDWCLVNVGRVECLYQHCDVDDIDHSVHKRGLDKDLNDPSISSYFLCASDRDDAEDDESSCDGVSGNNQGSIRQSRAQIQVGAAVT